MTDIVKLLRLDAGALEVGDVLYGDALLKSDAADEIERLRALTTWQPIDTAPDDGTKIDVFANGKRYANVRWSFSVNSNTGDRIKSAWDGWVYDGCSGQSYTPNLIGVEPTHWLPLPPPPADAANGA